MSGKVRQEERYAKQKLFEKIGEEGQAAIRRGRVVVIGCGALGCTIANSLVRAGVGAVKIVDRDCVELGNLHRQFLFDESDVEKRLPKAVAAAEHLRKVNSTISILPEVQNVSPHNVEAIVSGFDIILDGSDNMETRFLLNDVAVKHRTPWIYGGVAGSTGMSMTIVPGRTACLRCVLEELPSPGSVPTADTAGIINAVPAMVGAIEATEALKLLVSPDAARSALLYFDAWQGTFRVVEVSPRDDCRACGAKNFEFLDSSKPRLNPE